MVGGGRCCYLVAGAVVGGGGAHEVGESLTYRAGLSSWELTHLFCQLVQMRSVAPMVTDVVGDGWGGCCPVVSAAVGGGGTWDFQSFLLDFITTFLYIFIFADSRPPHHFFLCPQDGPLTLFPL